MNYRFLIITTLFFVSRPTTTYGMEVATESTLDKEVIKTASNGDIQALKALLEKGANINARDSQYGATALHWAVGSLKGDKKKKFIKYLVTETDIDINAVNKMNSSALVFAGYKGDFETVDFLLKQPKIDIKNCGTIPILQFALEKKRFETADHFLQKGLWPSIKSISIIFYLSNEDRKKLKSYSYDQELIDTFRHHGYVPEFLGKRLESLRERGARWVVLCPDSSFTPILKAIKDGDTKQVKKLIKEGTNLEEEGFLKSIHPKMAFQANPILLAKECGHKDLEQLFTDYQEFYNALQSQDIAKVNKLLESGLHINVSICGGRPLHIVLANEDPSSDLIKLLVEAGADCTLSDKDGRTPFYRAFERKLADIGQYLLLQGTKNKEEVSSACFICSDLVTNKNDCEFVSKRGCHKTHTACYKKLIALLNNDSDKDNLLQKLGIDATDSQALSLLQLALETKKYGVANRLLRKGIRPSLLSVNYIYKLSSSDRKKLKDYSFDQELIDTFSYNVEFPVNELLSRLTYLEGHGANRLVLSPESKYTPLLQAIKNGKYNEVKRLIEEGADVENALLVFSISKGLIMTANSVQLANECGHKDLEELLSNYNIFYNALKKQEIKTVQALLKKDLNVNAVLQGNPPLHIVLDNEHPSLELVEVLCEAGANVSGPDKKNQSPLYKAKQRQLKDIEEYLLSQGAQLKEVEGQDTCFICFDPLVVDEGNVVYLSSTCNHILHEECREKLVKHFDICSLCRRPIEKPDILKVVASKGLND